MSYFDIEKIRPTMADRLVTAKYMGKHYAALARMAIDRGPAFMLRQAAKYDWLKRLMNAYILLDMSTRTRTGLFREANAVAICSMTEGFGDLISKMFANPEKTVLHEDLIPPEILYGMGLNSWCAELIGIVLPMLQSDFAEHYIDVAENAGTPPDICSLPKTTMGLALEDQIPHPVAMVASNMPCDGGMSQYSIIEKALNVPTFRLDIPYNFYSERAVVYFAEELKKLIAFLEEYTPGRMDWDRMRQVCEERNRASEYQMELWDMVKSTPTPMAGEPIYLGHMMYMVAMPGQPRGTRLMKDLLGIAKQISKQGGALPDERYRAVLWNPPTLIYPELFIWAEQVYGVALLMDMISYNRHPYIDTRTPDTMLQGLARIVMEGPMARHTRGPSENFFTDLFQLSEDFSADMIWMAGHIGCKNTMALNGMFREKCRERGLPLLTINYDLSDTRVVSPSGIRRQATEFMENVIRAERIDGKAA